MSGKIIKYLFAPYLFLAVNCKQQKTNKEKEFLTCTIEKKSIVKNRLFVLVLFTNILKIKKMTTVKSFSEMSIEELRNLAQSAKVGTAGTNVSLLGLFQRGGKSGSFGENYRLFAPKVIKNLGRAHANVANRLSKGIYSNGKKVSFASPDRFNLKGSGFVIDEKQITANKELFVSDLNNFKLWQALFVAEYKEFCKDPKVYKFEYLPE